MEFHIAVSSVLIIIFSGLLGLQIFGPQPATTPLTKVYSTLEKNPGNQSAHINLGKYFLSIKDVTLANAELDQARQSNVLGLTSDGENLQRDIQNYETGYQQKLSYWQEIVNKNPTYADGWVQLLYLVTQRANAKTAQEYLKEISALDPILAKSLHEKLNF